MTTTAGTRTATRRKEAPFTAYQTEAGFQDAVIAFARAHGWRVSHHPDSRRLIGDAGAPDLLMVKPRVATLFVELKTTRGRLSEAQWDWRHDLESTGALYYLFRPTDWKIIEAVLTAPARTLAPPA